jgi:hypothetical protein
MATEAMKSDGRDRVDAPEVLQDGTLSLHAGGVDYDLWAQLHADVGQRLEGIMETMRAATGLGLAWATDTTNAADAMRQLESDLDFSPVWRRVLARRVEAELILFLVGG